MPLPDGTKLLLASYSLQDSNLIERTEMERGPAKTRRVSSDPTVTISAVLRFRSRLAIEAFRTWFYSKAGANAGAGWFSWTDPRTGTVRQVRLVSSAMGPLTPLAGQFAIAQQSCAIEYIETVPL